MQDVFSPDQLSDRDRKHCEVIRRFLDGRVVILIGMMGAGKSSIGRRLAQVMSVPFRDADTEIEEAAGMTIPEIFAEHGEAYFRAGESRVIARLLEGESSVLATGGGAWMDSETRAKSRENGISIWLKAPADVLMRRIRRRNTRPLLQTEDPESTLRALLATREPYYGTADITVESFDGPHNVVLSQTLSALSNYLNPVESP